MEDALASTVVLLHITALGHEVGDDAVEPRALVPERRPPRPFHKIAALARAQTSKVLAGPGAHVVVQRDLDAPQRLVAHRYIEEHDGPAVARLVGRDLVFPVFLISFQEQRRGRRRRFDLQSAS